MPLSFLNNSSSEWAHSTTTTTAIPPVKSASGPATITVPPTTQPGNRGDGGVQSNNSAGFTNEGAQASAPTTTPPVINPSAPTTLFDLVSEGCTWGVPNSQANPCNQKFSAILNAGFHIGTKSEQVCDPSNPPPGKILTQSPPPETPLSAIDGTFVSITYADPHPSVNC